MGFMAGAPKRMSKEQRRAALLVSGMDIFAEHAYDALSTDEIAKKAGISKGLFYHYFGNKRGYYLATIEAVAERMLALTAPDPEGDFAEALTGSVAGFVGFVQAQPRLFTALIRGGIGSDPEAAGVLERVRQTSVRRVFERLGLAEPDAVTRAQVYGWVGLTEAVCLDWVAGAKATNPELSRQQVVQLIAGALFAIMAQEGGA